MRLLVIGGHSRNIGKTSLVVDLIRAFPEAAWTAVKITQYGHGVCSVHGEHCGCAPDEHTVALDEERERSNRTDTSRFLAAGATRALWVRCKQGRMAEAMPRLRDVLKGAGNVLVESNTLLHFLKPILYLVVLDPQQPDFKDSARLFLDRADAFVLRSPLHEAGWPAVSLRQLESRPAFLQRLGALPPAELLEFVRLRFFDATAVSH
jgi:molybdopterin-guanine dinucleotide biosynthesis protein